MSGFSKSYYHVSYINVHFYGPCLMKQHTNTPVPLGKMWTPYRTKSGFINKLMTLKSRRVTGDQYFLIECSYKKNHYSTVKTLRKMHDWSIFMIALTSLLRLALQKNRYRRLI